MKADCPRTILSVLTLSRAHRWFIRVLPMNGKKDKRTLLLTKLFQTISFLAKNDIHFKKFSFFSVLVSILVSYPLLKKQVFYNKRKEDCPRTILSVLALSRAYRWFTRGLPMNDKKDKRTLLLTKLFQTISFLAQNDIHFKKFSFSSVLVSIFDSVIHSKTGFISAFHSASSYPRLSISLTRYARRYWQAMYPFRNICLM
jgi:hypothetical protein